MRNLDEKFNEIVESIGKKLNQKPCEWELPLIRKLFNAGAKAGDEAGYQRGLADAERVARSHKSPLVGEECPGCDAVAEIRKLKGYSNPPAPPEEW